MKATCLRKFTQPASLEAHRNWSRGRYLYAFEFNDGSVKVGVTGNPAARAQRLKVQFGRDIVRAHAAPCRGRSDSHFAERAALQIARRCGVQSKGNTELFYGLKFGAAVTVIKQMAAREYLSLSRYSFPQAA
jgi:hypothetical protein